MPRQAGAGQDSAAQNSSGTNLSSCALCLFAREPQGWAGGSSPPQPPVLCSTSSIPAGTRGGQRNTGFTLSQAPPGKQVPPAWESKTRCFYKALKLRIGAGAVLSVSAFLIFCSTGSCSEEANGPLGFVTCWFPQTLVCFCTLLSLSG